MRLLVVGHPMMVAYNQKKYVAMKRIEPALQLRLAVPRQHCQELGTYRCEVHPELNSDEVIPLPSILAWSHMTYVPDPVRMGRILQKLQPDVIHVEEEPHAAATVATVSLRVIFAPQAAMTLFTWDNLHRPRRFPVGLLKTAFRSYSLRQAEAVVCGNRRAEELLLGWAGYQGYTVVLPQFGLDPEDHAPGNESQLKQQLGLMGSIVVGYAGRLVPEKGIRLLLDALEELTPYPWKLLLLGSGPLEREIHEQWLPRFAGRIVHVRAVPHAAVPRYLRCLDVFVLASYAVPNWKEQFGLSLAQAMMLGIPCVASSSGALPEVAGPGALLFEEGSQQGLRAALRLLLGSVALRQELGARGRAFALERYSLAGLAGQYLKVFELAQHRHTLIGREPSHQAAAAGSNRSYQP